jgi:hypothetical protein
MPGLPAAAPNEGCKRRRAAAAAYRPNRVRLLLISDSPPADPARYFYFDGGDDDPLFHAVATVLFEESPVGVRAPWLKELRRRGVFSIELKPDAARRDEPLAPYVAPLLLNLDPLAPEAIVLVGADVFDAAQRALAKAGLPVVDVRVPAPSDGQEVEFRQALRQALVRAGLEKLIRPRSAAKRDA